MTTDLKDEEIITQVTGKLAEKFPAAASDQIETIVREEFGVLASRPVRDYFSVLTERAAKNRLRSLAA